MISSTVHIHLFLRSFPFDNCNGCTGLFLLIICTPPLQNQNVFTIRKRGIYGKGVRVRINDEGIESSHTEFKDRIDFNASCDAEFGGLPVVEPMNNESHHGIVTASLVGAMGNNSYVCIFISPSSTAPSMFILSFLISDFHTPVNLYIPNKPNKPKQSLRRWHCTHGDNE